MCRLKTVKTHDERRRELIQTAKTLFSAYGVEHTSISQIVTELNIAHGLFYYYFKSKEEVIKAVVETMMEEFEGALKERMERVNGDFYAGVDCFIATIFERFSMSAIGFNPKDVIMSRCHERLLDALDGAMARLWDMGGEQGAFKIEQSEWTFGIMLSGCLLMARRKGMTREIMTQAIAQMLSVPSERILGAGGPERTENIKKPEGI